MAKVYAINLEKIFTKNNFQKYLPFISNEKQQRILKCHHIQDAWRLLIAELLLRYLLIKKLKIKNNGIIFSLSKLGKPFLNQFPDVHFNVSHSGNWVVAIINDSPVGIDVEQVKPIKNALKISKRFFSQEEHQLLINSKEDDLYNIFFNIWTLKESYIKATGKGLFQQLQSFSINPNNKNIKLIDPESDKTWFFNQYNLPLQNKVAICSLSSKLPNKIEILTFSSILGLLQNAR
jgi:4'-phosphopantetheinyl transferase